VILQPSPGTASTRGNGLCSLSTRRSERNRTEHHRTPRSTAQLAAECRYYLRKSNTNPTHPSSNGNKDKHNNNHDDWDDEHAWERRDGYEYRCTQLATTAPQDGVTVKRRAGATADFHRGSQEIRMPGVRLSGASRLLLIRMNVGSFLFVVRSLKFTEA
jgi:hypothetical protein